MARILLSEPGDGGPQMRFRGVPKLSDERVTVERLLDDPALHTLTAAVNESDLAEAGLVGGGHILVDN